METGVGRGTGVEAPPPAAEPQVRVAIVQGGDTLGIGGGGGILVADASGLPVLDIAPGATARVELLGGGIAIRLGNSRFGPVAMADLLPRDPATFVRAAGRDYRGRITITPSPGGLLAINRVGIEDYLAGVVNAEMGRRAPGEEAALEAQAVVSRTYALRAMGRPRTTPWDVLATVADQVYLGVERETPAGRAAVDATRGTVLVWAGEPIEAFFHSTCAGRTAAGDEVFAHGRLPYLPSLRDQAPDGSSWCAISPRYRWREEWPGDRLQAILRETLASLGLEPGRAGDLRDLAVASHTPSGRVAALRIEFASSVIPVTGSAAVRRVLRPEGGALLRSAVFALALEREQGRVARLVAEGQGAGHGVGLCQWGAVGRARAGQRADTILAAYFPGARLERRW